MSDPSTSILWIIIVILLLLHFFFAGAETAFACCNKFKMQVKADEGSLLAKTLLKILDKYDRALTVVLIGNNIVAIAISSISTMIFLSYFKSTGLAEYTISIISSVIMTFIVYMVGDTLPKTIARAIPDTLSLIFTFPTYVLMIIFFPISILFEGGVKLFEIIFHVKGEETFTEDDLENEIDKAAENDTLDEDQAEIIQSTMEFLDTSVKDVLTPRDKIFALNIKDLNHQKLQELILTTNYSRIPIYDKVFDNMIGVLLIKIYFEEYEKDPHLNIRSILQKPYFVTNQIMIDDLFYGFRKHRTHIALVRDNHKKIIGMVTMEDILEEIVSDIAEPVSHRKKKA